MTDCLKQNVEQFCNWISGAFDAALLAGQPLRITQSACGAIDTPTAVIALGKAAGAMAEGARASGVTAPGIIITTDENHRQISGFDCVAASHPVPDVRGLHATEKVMDLVTHLSADDHLLLLISGGGSALLPAPAAGISLEQKIELNDALLASGLDIHDMNVIRRLFSRLKGGRLARLAAPAKITQFLFSDVPGDRLESIASGVAAADPVPFDYAKSLVKKNQFDRFDFVAGHMAALEKNEKLGPVRPGDQCLDKLKSAILASNAQCRYAAIDCLTEKVPGLKQIEAPELSGEAQQMARQLVGQICQHKKENSTADQVFAMVSGGETVVSMDSKTAGRGGRSQELALTFACHMKQAGDAAPRCWALLAGGTDGRDGPTDAAGGIFTSGQDFNLKAATNALRSHDSYPFLSSQNCLVKTGATGTNLGDLVLIVWSK